MQEKKSSKETCTTLSNRSARQRYKTKINKRNRFLINVLQLQRVHNNTSKSTTMTFFSFLDQNTRSLTQKFVFQSPFSISRPDNASKVICKHWQREYIISFLQELILKFSFEKGTSGCLNGANKLS